MPLLATVTLPNAFQYYDEWSVVNAGALANHPNLIAHTSNANVFNVNDLNALSSTVTEIIVENRCCRDPSFAVLDLTRFTNVRRIVIRDEALMYVEEVKLEGLNKLESIVIGDRCFMYVSVFNITGLNELESVMIGMNSFTQHKNGYGQDPNRHFYLKNCPKMKSLKMGRYSFSDYTVIEIENVNALEVIEMGDLNETSNNFRSASLQLSSVIVCVE